MKNKNDDNMMLIRILKPYVVIILFFVLTGCATHGVSTIVGGDYDKEKNQTDHFVIPFGSVSIPGKWVKSSYNSSSKQQFFKNDDSVKISIAFGPCDKYEFNADKLKTGWDFVKAYYEWESNYFVNNHGLEREIIEEDSLNNFIIWRLTGNLNNDNVDIYMLFGEKDCRVNNYSVHESGQWTEKQKLSFLKKLYLNSE